MYPLTSSHPALRTKRLASRNGIQSRAQAIGSCVSNGVAPPVELNTWIGQAEEDEEGSDGEA